MFIFFLLKRPKMMKFAMVYRYTSSKTVFYGDKRDDNSLRDKSDKSACLRPEE